MSNVLNYVRRNRDFFYRGKVYKRRTGYKAENNTE